jgi:hypothetical protein
MKRIFIRFEANKTGFICLFRIEAKSADVACETNKNGSDYSFQANILFISLVKGFPIFVVVKTKNCVAT